MTNPESLAGRQAMHENRIRELMAEWLDAVRRKDSAAMMRHYAADVVVFDVVPPATYSGVERASRRRGRAAKHGARHGMLPPRGRPLAGRTRARLRPDSV